MLSQCLSISQYAMPHGDRIMIMGGLCAAEQHSVELRAKYLRQVGCGSLVHDGQRRAIGPAQAFDHAMDARDVIVAGAHKLKQALHWVLPQDAGTCKPRHPAEGTPDVGIR